jgi:lipoprotein-releasing system ATP-binding protein
METSVNDCVSVTKICKQFDSGDALRRVVNDVSFDVAAGQSLAIMGPSGTGKSTLLNIVGTLDTPTSGSVNIFGTDPFTLSERELAKFRNVTIGFVFQAHHLLPQCSILENVLIPSLIAAPANGKETAQARAIRLLERVGLTPRMHARPGQLSGGECQRAAVVRSLINAPRLVLADEPTGSLDRASAETIGVLLSELRREENVALIVVTHSENLAQRMDRTLNLRDGALV